jgi:cyclopropane-fatty-acyl-phospholipid synthase
MFDKFVKNKLIKSLKNIHYGQLTITTPDKEILEVRGENVGYKADVEFKDWRVVVNFALKGDVGFAADYRDGYIVTSNLLELINFALQNEKFFHGYADGKFMFRQLSKLLYLTKRNSLNGSKRNITAHYDLGNNFYQLWLDPSMTYSAALFNNESLTLKEAQQQKYDRLLDKMTPGTSILEIGCGWGGFATRAIERNHPIKCITLSPSQAQYAQQQLSNTLAQVVIEDYRNQSGQYDYIVSIEMLEAVGKKYWPTYFGKIKQLLKPGGKFLLQTIVIADELFDKYLKNADLIRTFIFPGGMLPSEKSLHDCLNMVGLESQEIFRFGKDYALTLELWLEQFRAKIAEVKQLGFDDEFIRLWECYLCACIAGFNSQRINVIQMEVVHG